MQVFNRWTHRTSVIHSNGFSSLSCATQRLPYAVTSASETSSMPYQQNVMVSLQFVLPCCHGYREADCGNAPIAHAKNDRHIGMNIFIPTSPSSLLNFSPTHIDGGDRANRASFRGL